MKKESVEILFLCPGPDIARGHFAYSLGAGYIIATLLKHGIAASHFTDTRSCSIPALIKEIAAQKPRCVGFTCYDSNYFLVKSMAQAVKEALPRVTIIAGGPTPTFLDQVVLENIPEIDICVRHEGEYASLQIIENLRAGKKPGSIPGISYRDRSGIVRNPDRPLVGLEPGKEGLDILASPYISKALKPGVFIKQEGMVPILTARGCIYKCTFCNFTAISRNTIRYHSIQRVIDELRLIQEAARNNKDFLVRIYDDCFTLNRERISALSLRIIREKIRLKLAVATRADHLDRDLLTLLYQAGVRQLGIGLESASPRILRSINKIGTPALRQKGFGLEKQFIKKAGRVLDQAKKIGFQTEVSIILGLPSESRKDALRSLGFARKHPEAICFQNTLQICAGTALFRPKEKNSALRSEKFIQPHYRLFRLPPQRYQPQELPLLDSSHLARRKNLLIASYGPALMGIYPDASLPASAPDILWQAKKIRPQQCAQILPLQARFFFIPPALRNRPHSAPSFFPGTSLLTAMASFGAQKTITPDAFRKRFSSIRDCFTYSLRPLSVFPWKKENSPSGPITLFTITGKKDLEALKEILMRPEAAQKIFLGTNQRRGIIDLCRWTHACPAKNLQRFMVRGERNIYTCFGGKKIGAISDYPQKTGRSFAAELEKQRAARGCSRCPVRDRCSQCPCLDGLPAASYCRLRKKYWREIERFTRLTLFGWAR